MTTNRDYYLRYVEERIFGNAAREEAFIKLEMHRLGLEAGQLDGWILEVELAFGEPNKLLGLVYHPELDGRFQFCDY